jgi:hypothetical protein
MDLVLLWVSASAPPKDRPGDMPIGARGPGGQRRRLVKGDSQGLWFGFEESVGNSQLWQFDRTHGALVLNTFHPIWVKLDDPNARSTTKIEKQIQHLLEWLAIEVLHLLLFSPDETDFEHNRALVDNKVKHYVEMFIIPAKR